MGLTPLYKIGPRSEVGRGTGAMSGEVFYGRTADKKRRKTFVLGSPIIVKTLDLHLLNLIKVVPFLRMDKIAKIVRIVYMPKLIEFLNLFRKGFLKWFHLWDSLYDHLLWSIILDKYSIFLCLWHLVAIILSIHVTLFVH